MRSHAISLLLICSGANSAIACQSLIEMDMSEAKEYVAALEKPDGNIVEQTFAIENLLCAELATLREIAMRKGLLSQHPSIRAIALRGRLFAQSSFTVKLIPFEGMSKEQSEVAKKTSFFNFSVKERKPSESCIILTSGWPNCQSSAIYLSGNSVGLRYPAQGEQQIGTFELTDQGKLIGQFQTSEMRKDGIAPIKAELIVQ